MSGPLAAIVGGAAGAVALVGIVVIFLWFCLLRNRSTSRTSETGSSDPSLEGSDPYFSGCAWMYSNFLIAVFSFAIMDKNMCQCLCREWFEITSH